MPYASAVCESLLTVQRMTKKPVDSHQTAFSQRPSLRLISLAAVVTCALAIVLAGCATPAVAPPAASVTKPAVPAPVVAEPVLPPPPSVAEPTPLPIAPEPAVQTKEPPPVELPGYAKRGKRLPANGGAPGSAVVNYCRSFEIDRDAAAYFKTLARTKRLPTDTDVAERSRQAGQALTVQQVVERDWALRRESNKSAPQRCKVLGGSIDGSTALVVFEAELNGRRQRGIATVLQIEKKWRVRDHGDWVPAK